MSAGRAFAAGGDAKEFDADPVEPHLDDVVDRIENSFVPWVAAVHGPALGGGAEIMLACRYRICTPDALIGLPEVTLGVIPGAGGAVRLPRLVGLAKALEMITTGKPVKGHEALALGLVHEVAQDPVDLAESINSEQLITVVPVGELPPPSLDAALIDTATQTAHQKMRGQTAPLEAIAAIKYSCERPFEQASKRARARFLQLKVSAQAKALRHVFFAERAAKAPAQIAKIDTGALDAVAVVGGGTMGAGIAYALLMAKLEVMLLETDADGVERARGNVEKLVDAGRKRGVISADKAEALRSRLTVSTDYGLAASAQLAIEAAFESMDVKRDVLSKLQAVMSQEAILASNTSYLDLDEMALCLDDPSRLIGLHFFAPAHIMKLLEIVVGGSTSDRALAVGYQLAQRLKKIPVEAGVCDGFIGNRILARYREAADTLLMDGTTPWELDEAMVEFGYAMGPYEAQDLSGLDIAYANRRRQDATRDPNRRYIPISDRMVNEGRLGRKTSVGWYRYPGGEGKVVDPLLEDMITKEAHFAGVKRTSYDTEEIQRRLLLAMINEAANILHEGIAKDAKDIDLVTVMGYGFPRWRGGLMHYADALGAANIVSALKALCEEDALVWQPSAALLACAEQNIAIAAYQP
ncbi:MAG: enoyl-CoA hydratase/isomerase family protein [Gammaproteobacteria bacterium]|nr:enoyl-CoA hydratase/isomerase family protein [Gammaproteobacteria bacterium]